MLNKEVGITLRERRRIYDETVSIINQNQKMAEMEIAKKDRSLKSIASRTLKHSSTVLMLALGYHEEYRVDESGEENCMLLNDQQNAETSIKKEDFDTLILKLHESKELKTLLWKCCIKQDKKARKKLNTYL